MSEYLTRHTVPQYDFPLDGDEAGDIVGIELTTLPDMIAYWYDPASGNAYPRAGFEDLFEEVFPRNGE